MWRTVEMRELRLFLTLAQELHFGRTAEKLRLTPSRVSQSVRELEHKVGVQLVHRTSRRVQLTPAGERFERDIRPLVDQLDGVLERTSTLLEGTLKVGILSAAGGPHLVEIIQAFEGLHPECSVEVVQVPWDDPFGRLRADEIELMATWIPLAQPDLVVGPTLTSQARVLAVARDHPLAGRESVDVEELAEHQVGRFENWPRELHEAMVPSRTPGGRPIPHRRVAPTERGFVALSVRIARGEIVHPTVASAPAYIGDLELVFVPITGMPPLRSALVWSRRARDPKLRAFVAVARDVLAD